MRSGTMALLAGMVVLFYLPTVPALPWLLMLPAAAWLWWRFKRPLWRLAFLFTLGAAWAAIQAQSILSDRLPVALQGEDLVVEGVISSIPQKKPHAWRFQLDVAHIEHGMQRIDHPERIRLNWYGAEQPVLRAGDRWRLIVRLRRPHGFYNPGGFDYEKYLFQQGIGATGYVRHAQLARQLPRRWSDAPIQRLRQALRDGLTEQLQGMDLSGIVIALAVGERSGISEAQWAVLRNTGTAHLIAISGLHIGLLAGIAFTVVNMGWRSHRRLMLWQPAPRAAAVAALLCAILYAALAGFSLPTQRALIMVGTVLLALLLQRRVRPSHTLALTLSVVLLYDPTSVLSAGLWLSFGAVAMILYLFAGRIPRAGRLRQWGRLQWGVSLGLAPLLLLFFQTTSVVAPVANLIAVPVVSLVVVPMTLLLVAASVIDKSLSAWLANALDAVLQPLWWLLQWLQTGPWATWDTPAVSVPALCLAVVGLIILFLPRGVPHRYLGGVLWLPLLFPAVSPPQQDQVRLNVLDVGQGLAVVVQTARHLLVFDTGPRFSSGFNTGDAVVLPFLEHHGLRRIDKLIISHNDIDHRGGMQALLEATPVGHVYSSAAMEEGTGAVSHSLCESGDHWRWDGIEFEFIHPGERWRRALESENDSSCVLRVRAGNTAMLLTGDIESAAEAHLLARQRDKLGAEILVVPHHGSKTSSRPAFVAAVDPQFAVFPAGRHNRFDFPHPLVEERYRQRKARLFHTGRDGAIEFVIDAANGASTPRPFRRHAPRLWHDP